MAFLVVHLTDIHIKSSNDAVLGRGEAIGAAVTSQCAFDVSDIIFALGGDTAFSGKAQQFSEGRALLETIISKVPKSVRVHVLVVPGNHDCDFSSDQTARNILLKKITPSEILTESVSQILLEPLTSFLNFGSSVATSGGTHDVGHPLYHTIDFNIQNSIVRFHLFNTSCTSALHDKPGDLQFPAKAISPPKATSDALSIGILHHPINWFAQPESMRPLRNQLENICDVILTAHEHTADHFIRGGPDGSSSLYFEGGVLQDSDNPHNSTFQIIRINPQKLSGVQFQYQWSDSGFYESRKETPFALNDHSMTRRRLEPLRSNFQHELNDPGLPVLHPRKEHVLLSDIFEYPDFLVADVSLDRQGGKHIKGGNAFDALYRESKVLITGAEKCGKTALAKRLFVDFWQKGQFPIYATGKFLHKRDGNQIYTDLRNTVTKQYEKLNPDAFMQLNRSERVLIVDDVHEGRGTKGFAKETLKHLEQFFGRVILLGDDLACLDELGSAENRESELWNFKNYVILGFGEVLREQFVRKWRSLGVVDDAEPGGDQNHVHEACRLLNQVIRNQMIPPYPLFLIILLQQLDLGQPTVRGGSYGHLFSALVTETLARSRFTRLSIKDKHAYLASFAFALHQRRIAIMSEDEMRAWHHEYCEYIAVEIDYKQMRSDLVELSMLSHYGDNIGFRWKYWFCFFVAYYLSQHPRQGDNARQVELLCSRLHHRESAEIVLFLAHLTDEDYVLKCLLEAAERLLPEASLATLDTDVVVLNELPQEVPTIALPETRPDDNRKQMLETQDENIQSRTFKEADGSQIGVATDTTDDKIDQLLQVHPACKTIQILGQALRNSAGSMAGEKKQTVLKSIFRLARRVLGLYISFLEKDLPDMVQSFAEAIRAEEPAISHHDLARQVNQQIFGLSQMVCFAISRFVGLSASDDLLHNVLVQVLKAESELANKVFGLAIRLEKPGQFPRDYAIELYDSTAHNKFTQTLIKLLVCHHLYLYNVRHDTKQTICSHMDIQLPKQQLDQSTKRLIH